jgi:hypothetical protein
MSDKRSSTSQIEGEVERLVGEAGYLVEGEVTRWRLGALGDLLIRVFL